MSSFHTKRLAFIPLVALTAFVSLNCSSTSSDAGSGGSTSKAGSSGSGGTGAAAVATGGGGSNPMVMAGGGAPATGGGGASTGGGGQGTTAGTSGGPAGAPGGTAGATGGAAGTSGGPASGGGVAAGSGGQGGAGGFALSSSKLTEGAKFADEFTCATTTDHSPPLTWTAGPSGTLSYAIVFLDTNITFNHWVIYDIPPATLMLPEALPTDATLAMPAGAKQKSGQGMGYLGPCPSGVMHTYRFTIYALDVAALPGVTASSSTAELSAAIQMHDIASARLSGTSDAKKP